MKALVDADLFCYSFGNMEELESGGLLPWEITRSLVDANINSILSATKADTHQLYLTDSPSNFRLEVATILPYKGGRPSEKPPHHAAIRQHLIDNWNAKVVYGMEADDALGIAQCYDNRDLVLSEADAGNTVICSRDKDLAMIPGHHYSWECGKQPERKWFVTETEGLRSFYKQLLTGDKSVDNILGLFGVGAKSVCVKRIDTYETELEMFTECWLRYEERFGSYAWQFLVENAQLLWMLRCDPAVPVYADTIDRADVARIEVLVRLEELYDEYKENLDCEARSDAAEVPNAGSKE